MYFLRSPLLFLFLSADDSEAADLWLLNSCTVKNPSEDNFRNAIKKAQELDKHLVVAGCVPQGQPKHQSIKGISVIGVCRNLDFVIQCTYTVCVILEYLTNRFHFAVRLYSDNAQMTSKHGKNKEIRYEPQMFLPCFDVLCALS